MRAGDPAPAVGGSSLSRGDAPVVNSRVVDSRVLHSEGMGVFDVRLPALVTEAFAFTRFGVPEEVSIVQPERQLDRVLRCGHVVVKMIAAPITEAELRCALRAAVFSLSP